MKTNIFFVVLAFFSVVIAGCQNDIDLNASDTSGLLCINGNLTAGADDNYINVALTGKERPENISDAKVVVSVNGSEVEIVKINDEDDLYYRNNFGYYHITAKFNPGDYVMVDVYYDGQHASGGGIVPEPIKEASVKVGFEKNVPYKRGMWSLDYNYSDMTTMTISITDPTPAHKNFFRMAVSQSDTVKMRVDEDGRFLNSNTWFMTTASAVDVVDERAVYGEYESWGYSDDHDKYEYYFDNDPILSAEVVKSQGDISLVDAVDNVYKIFTDNFFNGSSATLNVMRTVVFDRGWRDFWPEKYYYNDDSNDNLKHDISYYAPRYTHRNYIDVYSITEDEYYYLKVMNARGPESYFEYDDGMSLTGDVKLPSNVSGGTGNIFLSSCIKITGCLFEDYVPEYGGKQPLIYYVD